MLIPPPKTLSHQFHKRTSSWHHSSDLCSSDEEHYVLFAICIVFQHYSLLLSCSPRTVCNTVKHTALALKLSTCIRLFNFAVTDLALSASRYQFSSWDMLLHDWFCFVRSIVCHGSDNNSSTVNFWYDTFLYGSSVYDHSVATRTGCDPLVHAEPLILS